MEKKILTILVCGMILIGVCGCDKKIDNLSSKKSVKEQEEKVKVKKLTQNDDLMSFIKKLSDKVYYKPMVTGSSKSSDYSADVESHLLYIEDEYIYDITIDSDNKNISFNNISNEEKEINKYKITELKLESNNEEVYLKGINSENKEYILSYPYYDSELINFLHIQKTWARTSYTNYSYYYDYDIAMKTAKGTAKALEAKKKQKTNIPTIDMSAYDVVNSEWGEPDKEIKKKYSWGTFEQWIYNNQGYVYFLNGNVTSVSEK